MSGKYFKWDNRAINFRIKFFQSRLFLAHVTRVVIANKKQRFQIVKKKSNYIFCVLSADNKINQRDDFQLDISDVFARYLTMWFIWYRILILNIASLNFATVFANRKLTCLWDFTKKQKLKILGAHGSTNWRISLTNSLKIIYQISGFSYSRLLLTISEIFIKTSVNRNFILHDWKIILYILENRIYF